MKEGQIAERMDKLTESIHDVFKKNSEEEKRAISIFAVLTHRTRNEVMPDVDKLIGRRFKRFFVIPKKLNNYEREMVLGSLCELPLFCAIHDICDMFESEQKADKIGSYLKQLFSTVYGITNEDLVELEEALAGGSRVINVAMGKVCKQLNSPDDLLLSMELATVCIKKLAIIGSETVQTLCDCPEEDLLKTVEDALECR